MRHHPSTPARLAKSIDTTHALRAPCVRGRNRIESAEKCQPPIDICLIRRRSMRPPELMIESIDFTESRIGLNEPGHDGRRPAIGMSFLGDRGSLAPYPDPARPPYWRRSHPSE